MTIKPVQMPLIACSRMYNLSPQIASIWDELFAWLSNDSRIDLDVIRHPAPAPLSELWGRPDMGVVFMCGFPFSEIPDNDKPQPLAVPISSADWANSLPVYASHIVVRADAPIEVADLGSVRFGWTVRDSQSGYNAPRRFLAQQLQKRPFTGQAIGPLLNPKGVIDALIANEIDAGALDAYAWQLLEQHEPAMIADLRVLATTETAPFPLLVTAKQQPKEIVAALKASLLKASQCNKGRVILQSLGLSGFADPNLSNYESLSAQARHSDYTLEQPW
jgi:ABC-type phosphate/phosphonate transport system substrate-binding protein